MEFQPGPDPQQRMTWPPLPRTQPGARAAEEDFFRRYAGPVCRRAAALCRRWGLKGMEEDACQEALVETLRAWPEYDGRDAGAGPLPPFLSRVVWRCVLNFRRRHWKEEKHYDRRQTAEVWMEQEGGGGLGGCTGPRQNSEDPAAGLVAREEQALLEQAVKNLAGKDQHLVRGRLDGKTLKKLAEEIGWGSATGKRHWCQVLARLRRLLCPEFREE